jgi:hypothetical protein
MTCDLFSMGWGAVATAIIMNLAFFVVGVVVGRRPDRTAPRAKDGAE